MLKFKRGLFLFCLGVLCWVIFSEGAWAAPEIRVCLTQGVAKGIFEVSEGEYVLEDVLGKRSVLSPGEKWEVIKEGPYLKLLPEKGEPLFPLEAATFLPVGEGLNLFTWEGKPYRGKLVVYNEAGGLVAVNVLGMEAYLYGVIGPEMGASAPLEALKAQAVVSRSYALSFLGKGLLFDVKADTSNQVYKGYSAETARIRQAGDETAGEVLFYGGKVVLAYFHANAGGYTEDSENVWGEVLPYLRGVPSPDDVYALRYPRQVNGWPANTYQWEKIFTREELAGQVARWNEQNQGKVENQINVGEIIELQASSKTKSGRVTELKLIGTEGTKSFYRDRIRSPFGLRSTLFNLTLDATVWLLGNNSKKASAQGRYFWAEGKGKREPLRKSADNYFVAGAEETRAVPKVFQKVTFTGKGYGHGVGMSQWGAQGMAAQGKNYREILLYYYQGVQIASFD